MVTRLHVLILEDRPADAVLMVYELRRAGFDPVWHRVETEEDYLAHLHAGLDVILADYSLPQFDGLRALQLLQARGGDTPFLIVSATIDEELAVSAMRQGAADYLLKDRLARLGPAVMRAMQEVAERRARQQAEEALRTSEARFRMMAEAAPVLLRMSGEDMSCTYFNQGWLAFTGRTMEQELGYGWADNVHADDAKRCLDTYVAAFAARQPFEMEYRLRRADGVYRWVLDRGVPLLSPEGHCTGYLGSAIDITTRQEAEQLLRQTQAELEQRVAERTALLGLIQQVTRAANEATGSTEALQYALDCLCAYTGWPIGHVYLAVAPGADRWSPTALWHLEAPERFMAFQQVTQTLEMVAGEDLVGRVGARGQPEWLYDVVHDPAFVRRHAAQAVGLATGMAWPLLVGREVAGVLEFYTTTALEPDQGIIDALAQIGMQLGRVVERERAVAEAQRQQEALFQREKLASMSTVLASVAHELNNPLASLVLQAELVRQDVREGPLAEPVMAITQAAARCERLVRQFLTLARQHPPERTAVELNTLVTDTLELLASPLQVDQVAVQLDLDLQMPAFGGDPHQLQQVVLNLLTNAHQALRAAPGLRTLTLRTRYDPQQAQVTLAVSDSGPGIPPALQGRIFEPFFTTNPPGVGTGLGLPLCRGIVEAHGGTLEVTSTLGQGATFALTLPVAAVPVPALPAPTAEARPGARRQTILVVDDEGSLASGLARLLRRDGHTVDTVANGRLALAQVEAQAYDVVMCDVRMPELDGPSFYRLLARQQPHLCQRFIFLTGDTLEPATLTFLEATGVPCLLKPFRMTDVRRVLNRIIHQPSPPGVTYGPSGSAAAGGA